MRGKKYVAIIKKEMTISRTSKLLAGPHGSTPLKINTVQASSSWHIEIYERPT